MIIMEDDKNTREVIEVLIEIATQTPSLDAAQMARTYIANRERKGEITPALPRVLLHALEELSQIVLELMSEGRPLDRDDLTNAAMWKATGDLKYFLKAAPYP